MSVLNKENMRAELARKGWTYDDLAEKIGVSVATVGNAFRAGRCSIPVAIKIGNALGLSPNEMLTGWGGKEETEGVATEETTVA